VLSFTKISLLAGNIILRKYAAIGLSIYSEEVFADLPAMLPLAKSRIILLKPEA
jgi:hypothetical protein